MKFTVIGPNSGGEEFSGSATFHVLDSGALEIHPGPGSPRSRVLYSPTGWTTVEVTKEDDPGVPFRVR